MPSRPPSVDEEDRRRCRLVAAPMSAERALLQRLIAGPVSGDALARENGETRAAVWKRIESLREAAVAIQAQPGRGYALAPRSEEHTSELQSLIRISYGVLRLTKKTTDA